MIKIIPINRTKIVLGIALVMIGVLLAYSIFYYVRSRDHINLTLYVLPTNSKIVIGNTQYSNGSIWLSPGNYTIQVTSDGFQPYKGSVTVQNGDKNITVSLMPESAEAIKWQSENNDKYKQLENLADAQDDISANRALSSNPIISALPYRSALFSIGYHTTIDGQVVLDVYAEAGYYNAAMRSIADLGYNPAEYQIEFNNYTNPFGDKK